MPIRNIFQCGGTLSTIFYRKGQEQKKTIKGVRYRPFTEKPAALFLSHHFRMMRRASGSCLRFLGAVRWRTVIGAAAAAAAAGVEGGGLVVATVLFFNTVSFCVLLSTISYLI